MRHTPLTALGTTLALLTGIAAAQSVTVTVDNFRRAETDTYFGIFSKRAGGLGKLYHYRNLPPIDGPGVRPNRDTLYSEVVFDLDAGPVTITLPNAGKRFMSMIVIDQDHYAQAVYYGGGSRTLTRQQVGTRYVFVAVRTLVDPGDPKDLERVHALQDAIKVAQPGGPGRFDVPDWDGESQKKVRNALLALGDTLPDLRRAAGRRNEVDPVRHLIGTASAWGLNPDKDAIYLNVVPAKERRQRRLPARGQGRPGRRLLVDQRLRRRGPLREEPVRRLHAEQHHREEGRRRVGGGAVRRLRRQDRELPADHEGLELHGAAVPAAPRSPERQVDVPRGHAVVSLSEPA